MKDNYILDPEDGMQDASRCEHACVMSYAPLHDANLFRQIDLRKQRQ